MFTYIFWGKLAGIFKTEREKLLTFDKLSRVYLCLFWEDEVVGCQRIANFFLLCFKTMWNSQELYDTVPYKRQRTCILILYLSVCIWAQKCINVMSYYYSFRFCCPKFYLISLFLKKKKASDSSLQSKGRSTGKGSQREKNETFPSFIAYKNHSSQLTRCWILESVFSQQLWGFLNRLWTYCLAYFLPFGWTGVKSGAPRHEPHRASWVKGHTHLENTDDVTHSLREKVQVLVVIRTTMFHVTVRLYVVLIKQHEGELLGFQTLWHLNIVGVSNKFHLCFVNRHHRLLSSNTCWLMDLMPPGFSLSLSSMLTMYNKINVLILRVFCPVLAAVVGDAVIPIKMNRCKNVFALVVFWFAMYLDCVWPAQSNTFKYQ